MHGLSKEMVSDEGEFSMGHMYDIVHLFPVRRVKRGGLSKEVLLYMEVTHIA